jgi:hypothetical protein
VTITKKDGSKATGTVGNGLEEFRAYCEYGVFSVDPKFVKSIQFASTSEIDSTQPK